MSENETPQQPQGQQQPQLQPMQEVYPNCGYSIQTAPDGGRILAVQVPMPRKVMIFMLSVDEANEIGRLLQAPSVARPANRGSDLIVPPGILPG